MNNWQRRYTPARGYSGRGAPHCDYEAERLQRTKNVLQALWFAKNKLPSAVRQETGEALDDVLGGILPSILMALAVVAGSSLVGMTIGAIGGAFAGAGVGAVPGAIAGGSAGFSAGMWILEWLGVAFLAVHVGKNMHQVTWLLQQGFNQAWGHGARDRCGLRSSDIIARHRRHDTIPDHSQVMQAADKFARAVAIVIRLVLEGVVLYLTARGIAKLPELVAQLRSSRLGEGFALWVEKNHLRLMRNPKLNQNVGSATVKPVRVLDHTGVPEQPRPGTKKEIPPLRQEYVDAVAQLKNKRAAMQEAGYSEEEIARTLHAERRELGVKYKNETPAELLENIYKRNEEKYGDKLGPSIDYLRSRGKSWEQISDSACRTGGKDLGF